MCEVYNATDVRKNWSEFCDLITREKPGFVRRTRDRYVMVSSDMLLSMLDNVNFTATSFREDDGTVTISSNEMDLITNASTKEEAIRMLGRDILEYSNEYYDNFQMYYNSKNRRRHLPYIMKALLINDEEEIGNEISCLAGKN